MTLLPFTRNIITIRNGLGARANGSIINGQRVGRTFIIEKNNARKCQKNRKRAYNKIFSHLICDEE